MKVKLSSPCAAMLMYEASKSQGHCEGCLTGETALETKMEIDDSAVTRKTENILCITSIGELPMTSNCAGNILGWYKFCRRRSSRLTVREKSIHRRFCKHLAEKGEAPDQFISILVQEVWCPNMSTYGWKFSTYLLSNGRFEPCKVEIANLKASSCGTYMHYPIIHQQERLPQVKSALLGLEEHLNIKDNNFPIVEGVRKAGGIVLNSLLEVVAELNSTDDQLSNALDEQEKLKLKIKELNDKLCSQTETEVVTADAAESSHGDHDKTSAQSSDDCSSESSENVFGNTEKISELLSELTTNEIEKSGGNPGENRRGNAVAVGNGPRGTPANEGQTPPDPFVNLVDLAKADLSKSEKRKEERGWEESGRKMSG